MAHKPKFYQIGIKEADTNLDNIFEKYYIGICHEFEDKSNFVSNTSTNLFNLN